jgi:hypothetical protein
VLAAPLFGTNLKAVYRTVLIWDFRLEFRGQAKGDDLEDEYDIAAYGIASSL